MKHNTHAEKSVMVVDDHPLVCQGLAQLIDQENDLAVCCQAPDAATALEAVERCSPDLIVVDISLKDISGLELTRVIKERFPDTSVLVLSMHDELLYAERALKAGAGGYIMKQEPPEMVLEAIRTVLDGDVFVSKSMASRLMKKAVHGTPGGESSVVDSLSDREFEVFQLIGQGLGTRDIAGKLCVSVKTVESHQANMRQKLNIKTGRELARFAIMWLQKG